MMNEKTLEIQADDLPEIAITSAIEAQHHVAGPIIVEDAGLFIGSLNGFPGPYSAYAYRTLGCKGILMLIEQSRKRDAEFQSVIAYTDDRSTQQVRTFLGVVRGEISEEIRGDHGFGFDPIFIPSSFDLTFAEINVNDKNMISHRARSLEAFASWYLLESSS
jgi:XTP/dITP diphosphohydrolase